MAEIIEMPKLSDTMTTGTLVKWLKNEGDEIATGDMIAEVETDKATMEVECFEDGFMLKQYVAEGDSVSIGAPICAVGEEGEEAPEPNSSGGGESGHDGEDDDEAGKTEEASSGEEKEAADQQESEEKPTEEEAAPPAPPAKKTAPAGDAPAPPAPQTKDGKRIKSSPLARKIAAELDVDLTRVEGSGPGGRIIRADVEAAAEAGTASASAPTGTAAPSGTATPAGPAFAFAAIEETTTKVSNMRASIAKALVKSKQEAPHFYLQSEVDAAPLARMRKDLNGFLAERDPQAGGVKYTVNDLILRAAVLAAQRVPAINRSWQGDKILQSEGVHLAFGVAIDDGLVTPVIRDAQDKPLRSVAAEARELIGKARNRKLKPDEMAGSTLTVTNLGMYGITDFYGIINPGNAAILSVGATRKEPVVDEDDRISVGYRMKVGLSGDHRVIDGAVGAQYLDALRDLLEKPSILLV